MEYTREYLIKICEDAFVPVDKWMNRDTPQAQTKLGLCYVLLKDGCRFRVTTEPNNEHDNCVTNDHTIWLYIMWPSFSTFEYEGPEDEEHFYLPTRKRLKEKKGRDWY